MDSLTFRNAFAAFISYYLIMGALTTLLAITGLWMNDSVFLLWLVVIVLIASLWLAREMLDRFTGVRISIWSTFWYIVALPVLIGLIIFLPLVILLTILIPSFEASVFFAPDETSSIGDLGQNIVASLIISLITAYVFLREQRRHLRFLEAEKRRSDKKGSRKEEIDEGDSDATETKAPQQTEETLADKVKAQDSSAKDK